ncbi:AbrB/MazE/SpoVT family DNA-binding domain-containing protein [Dethiobacter alkaliphilus]|uniref:Transcriptional regulator, AbrB family n=1 Tax=Dethiobacter alkaliphilus AHT 1 TaxID=555088 RepID=C0GG05_DETAL|nr:AbrB/MazE/SpoVT family DNA-binding domain-containing protein [Dethiobacter alkaliphilus]EEG77694.1 transcriptional regulator, AbrB family [Dethiobacter alkaliphilus AHT 1]
MNKVKITSKGQITLPKQHRDQLMLREGDYLNVYIDNDSIVLKPESNKSEKEAIYEYCRKHGSKNTDLAEARRILAKVPYSLSEQVRKLREEE